MKISISSKQFKHYKSIAKQSLEKFRKISKDSLQDSRHQLADKSWQLFVDDDTRLRRFAENVDGVAGILGFSREISAKLSLDDLIGKVIQRFAEIDLAEYIIRELAIDKSDTKLIKLSEGSFQKCDFKYPGKPAYYFESKYTKNISSTNIATITRNALQQIRNSIEGQGIGCVWIFTYEQPIDSGSFQREVELVNKSLSSPELDFRLSVQVYGRGLYGYASIA